MNKPMENRLAFVIPLLFFLAVFVAGCGVLAAVFIRSVDVSIRAEEQSGAVQLCRNYAQILRAAPDWIEDEELYFDRDYRQTERENAFLKLTISGSSEPAAAGSLRSYSLTASEPGGEELYQLTVEVYIPDGGPANE